MVAASARRRLLEVIHDIGRLESLVGEPNGIIKASLQEIVTSPTAVEVIRRRAAA